MSFGENSDPSKIFSAGPGAFPVAPALQRGSKSRTRRYGGGRTLNRMKRTGKDRKSSGDPDARIAVFIPSLRAGGTERAMLTLAREFDRRGLVTDLVLGCATGEYLPLVPDSIRIVDLQASRMLFSLFGLIRYVKAEQPRVMLSALPHANILAIVSSFLSRQGVRTVISERSNLSRTLADTKLVRERFLPFLMRMTYGYADRIIAVSHGVADDLIRGIGLDPNSVEAIHNPLDVEHIRAQASAPIDHPFADEDGRSLLVAVGRLDFAKDHATLISSFSRVVRKRPVKLAIVGEGPLRASLQTMIDELELRSSVALIGFSKNPYPWMRRAALFLHSSRREGFPNTIIEAMACGARVVSTNCESGPAEILEDGKWGRLVAVGDVQAFAAAILAGLDDANPPDVRRRAQDFSVEIVADAYLLAMGMGLASATRKEFQD
ncbi:glycosyltransferase [Mesorhizobium australicum]|uniref:glycosyltransferase n=1 Tax=Mesorhizobium australicum TaxID=536018 RepID=UPI00041B2505|nr:glycosyltransferase [Mesorhizobium sp. LNHC220B00]